MSGYKTVLVGTDGSDSSLRAVDRAGHRAADGAGAFPCADIALQHGLFLGSGHGGQGRTQGNDRHEQFEQQGRRHTALREIVG